VHPVLNGALDLTLGWLNPLTLAAAALWFGAAGLIAEGVAQFLALPVALLAALCGGVVVHSISGMFVRSNTAPLQATAEGAVATVNATIRPDLPGEVIFTLEGLTRSVAARSEDGSLIPRGTTVAIVRRDRGIAWVTPLDPLLGLNGGMQPRREAERLE
jgi:membrane protein implicated in regulation of membrane protease activity